MVQAVRAAVQGRHRLPLDFRLQRRDAFGGQVGQVGRDHVHRLRQRFQQVAFHQRDPVGHVVHPHVVGRHVQRRVKGVAGVDARGGQVDGQVDRDGAGSGAHVRDDQLAALHAHQRHEQGVFHQRFRLGPRDQHVRVDQQVDAVELAIVQDVGQRLPGEPSLHDGGQLRLLLRRHLGFLLGEDGLARHPHHVHHHHLRLQPGIGDAGRFQRAVGGLDYVAQAGHQGITRRWRPDRAPGRR